jgi:hypothetical protein
MSDLFLPIISLLKFIKIFTLKNVIKKAGKKYFVNENSNNKYNKILILCSIIILTFSILAIVFMGEWFVLIIGILFCILFLSDIFILKLYGNVIGIYENGIIDNDNEFNNWTKIHSYIIIEKDISGYYEKGGLFEFKNIENIEDIKNLFIKNNIKERENM